MSKIKIEDIQSTLAQDGWKLISSQYDNLNSELEFECDEGHKVFSTWNKIRQQRFCPICATNKFKDMKPLSIQKKKDIFRILALDQASHITGYALLDNKELVSYGTFKAKKELEKDRLHEVNEWFISQIHEYEPDLIAIEGIQYQQGAGVTTFQTLARLQGILMETCMQAKIPFQICPTNTWRAFCKVKGRARADKKQSMQLLIKQWYDISVSDDCADAIGIGKYLAETYSRKTQEIIWEE